MDDPINRVGSTKLFLLHHETRWSSSCLYADSSSSWISPMTVVSSTNIKILTNGYQQDKNEQAEENNRLQELNGEARESSGLLQPDVEGDKPPEVSEQDQEKMPQNLNEQVEESSELQVPDLEEFKIQDLSEQEDESKPGNLNEQAEVSGELVEPNVEDNKTQGLPEEQNQENKLQGPDEQAINENPEDLNIRVEEQVKTSELNLPVLPDKEPSLYPLDRLPEIYLSELQSELQIFAPHHVSDHILRDQAKGGRLPDLKEEDEETSEVLISQPEDKKLKQPSIMTIVDLKPTAKKKQKDALSHVSARSTYSMRSSIRNLPAAPLQRPPTPKVKPETVDKGTQCKLMLMRKLQLLPRTSGTQRRHVQRPKTPTADKATQINSNYGRLEKKLPASVRKKETASGKTSPSKSLPSKTRSPILRKEIDSCYDNIATENSLTIKKGKKPKAIYNFHITVYEGENEMDSMCKAGPRWEESACSSGLSKACTVFSTLKSGMIHTSDLLLTLHTLGILVTNAEMCRTLRHVKVTASGTLDFSEFLEVVNNTSPFTDTEDFQTILWIFRKINKGMVALDDLETVLIGLGVNLNNKEIQQTLGCIGVKNGYVDILNFLQTACALQRGLEEKGLQYESDTTDKNPFHDVTELVNADARWRKKYSDEDFNMANCLVPQMTWSSSDEDLVFGQPQRRVSGKLSQKGPINIIYAEEGDKRCGRMSCKSGQKGPINVIYAEEGDKRYGRVSWKPGQKGPINVIYAEEGDRRCGRVSWKPGQKGPINVIYPGIEEEAAKGSGIKPTQSQLGATDLRSPRSTSSAHNTEGGDKGPDTAEVTEAQTDPIDQKNTIEEEQ